MRQKCKCTLCELHVVKFLFFFDHRFFTHKKLKLLIIYELHKFTKKVAWSVQNECFFRRRWFVASTLGHQREFWGTTERTDRKKREKLCQWMTSGVRFNKLLFGTFLNGYGGAAGCLLGFVCGMRKIIFAELFRCPKNLCRSTLWCLQIDENKRVIEPLNVFLFLPKV